MGIGKTSQPKKSPFTYRWPVDYSVRIQLDANGNLQRGHLRPPDGHYRRCQANNSYGLQCENFAKKLSKFCRWHQGNNTRKAKKLIKALAERKNLYTRSMSRSLSELLEEVREAGPDDVIDLSDEIEVSRTVAMKWTKLLSLLMEKKELNEDKIKPETMMAAMSQVQDAIDKVATLATKQAKIRTISPAYISLDQLELLFVQFQRILEKRLMPENEDIFTEISKDLDQVKVVRDDFKKWSTTPVGASPTIQVNI